MDNMLYTPQAMQQVGSLPLGLLNPGLDLLRRNQTADQSTLAEIMAQRQRAGEKHGLDMRQGEATLEGTMLGNQGTRMKNQMQAATLPSDIEAKIVKNTSDMDEAKFKAWERKVEQGVADNDPRMLAVWERMPAIRQAREKAAAEKEKWTTEDKTRRYGIDVGASTARYTADKAAERAAAAAAAKADRVPRNYTEQDIFYQEKARKAREAGDEEEANYFLQLATAAANAAENEKLLAAKAKLAGTPDIAALGGIPVHPMPTATANRPATAADQPQQYVTGQTYTGATGTYRYKGGDPKDKNNWEKVGK